MGDFTDRDGGTFDPRQFLASLPAGRTDVRLRARQTLFRQGDQTDSLYYIQKGRIRLTVTSAEGKQRMIAMLGPGNFMGESCLAGQSQQIATACAMMPSEVTRVAKAVMVRMLRQEPAFAESFTSYLLSRNAQIQDDLIDQLFNSSERRLARVLLLLANASNDGQLDPLPPISQELRAERVGTTRARINAFMTKFRKLGYIEYDGALKVNSSLVNVLLRDVSRTYSHNRRVQRTAQSPTTPAGPVGVVGKEKQ
jgi:CRP/FNR family transcriptional regulator, cyclic AMP receptor protein